MLCIDAAGATIALAIHAFTLSWTHSVERVEWRESWQVTESGLVLAEAEVKGSGAGMEIPAGAVLRDGGWHYRPDLPALPEVSLADAGRGADWTICYDGACRQLRQLVGSEARTITLRSCPDR